MKLARRQYSAPARGKATLVVQPNIEETDEIRTADSFNLAQHITFIRHCRSKERVSKAVLPSSSFRLLRSDPQTSSSY